MGRLVGRLACLSCAMPTLALLWSTPISAAERLDIEEELSNPDVKLVVVDFYATWCKPCMEAVPQWKSLHYKYGSRGLKFIVVSAEGNRTCSKAPDWTPDKTVCDEDGRLQEAMGVKQLPQSFLFSWQGNLSITSHDVEPISEAIRNYFLSSQLRIMVDTVDVIGGSYAISSNPEILRKYVVGKVTEYSKFDVVSEAHGHIAKSDASSTCPTEFPVNSILRISVQGNERNERRLTLLLEKDGCIKASVTEKYTGSRDGEDLQSLENAANTAVKKMMGQLVSQFARVRNAGLVSRQGSTVAAPSQVLIKPATPDRREVESPVQAVQQAGDVRDLASMMSGVSVDQWPFAFSREQVKKLQYMHASFDGEILRVAEHMKYRDFTAEDFFRAYETWKTSGQKRVENIEMIAVLNHIGVNLRNIDLNTPLTTKYYNEKIVGGKVLRDTGLGLFIGLSAASLVVLIGLTTGINPEVGSILWSMSDIPTTALIMLTVATPCYVVGYNRMKTWLPDGTLENTPKYGLDKLKAASLGKASGLSIGVAPFFDGKTGGLSLGGTF